MPFLLIKRFDRKNVAGKTVKLVQEDFCQALGNNIRYGSEDGGVDMEAVAGLIKNRLPAGSSAVFLAMSLFSMMIGNPDDHAGNYAILQTGEYMWEMAPAYDLASVSALKKASLNSGYDPLEMIAAMPLIQPRKFGEHYDPLEITAADVRKICSLFEISKSEMRELVNECHEKIFSSLGEALKEAKKNWKKLKLNDYTAEFSEACINIFEEAVKERAEAVFKKPACALKPTKGPK